MKRLIFALLLLVAFCAIAAEPPVQSDSLQSDSMFFAADSTDSLSVSGGIVHTTLIPLAIVVATAGVFLLLFTTRSK
ncbi:hypothetical protein IT157_02700 [bacterium]|nr:hypothetical protein [bacterium]